jgi:hypothetical protein
MIHGKSRWTKLEEESKNSPCYRCGNADGERYVRPHSYKGVKSELVCCTSCLQNGILRS